MSETEYKLLEQIRGLLIFIIVVLLIGLGVVVFLLLPQYEFFDTFMEALGVFGG